MQELPLHRLEQQDSTAGAGLPCWEGWLRCVQVVTMAVLPWLRVPCSSAGQGLPWPLLPSPVQEAFPWPLEGAHLASAGQPRRAAKRRADFSRAA